MPKDTKIKKVLLIGSGSIVIGQAAEFDYSGTQALKSLKEEGVEVVLINSNPATIMTDRGLADRTYIEPITVEYVEKIIAKEKPDSLIAGMGGQTALNLACDLHDAGILDRYNIRIVGTPIDSIKESEDRQRFKNLMEKIGHAVVESEIVTDVEGGLAFADRIGYPVVVRPSYTLGGTGGGLAENSEELNNILLGGLRLSQSGQAIVEKSIKGYKEIEFEVMRDGAGNCITICSMENIDPVGVHTGDSIVVAPAQTLSDEDYEMLRLASMNILESVGIQGGCNIQFALDPHSSTYYVIEINPRVSRSSALASKATGYPIAKVATKIALGYTLDEIVKGKTALFEPTIDYIVAKIPKWPFDKFVGAKKTLGTKMMATGEVMSIGHTLEEALLKAVRSLEIGQYSLERKSSQEHTAEILQKRIQHPDDERLFDLAELLRRGFMMEQICELTGIDPFFVKTINNIVEAEEALKKQTLDTLDTQYVRMLKQMGFSDKGIADFLHVTPLDIYKLRKQYNILASYKVVDICAGEFAGKSKYCYSSYHGLDEVIVSDKSKVLVIGSGPIRIGQGIEFDYCSVHSVMALRKSGIETIIVNNNPETISTDFDISDRLYFEPLTEEDVLSILEKERPDGVILQFGGQTAIKLAQFLHKVNIPIYGTKPEKVDIAEDREKFDALLESLNLKRPKGKAVWSLEEGIAAANFLKYPVLVRPSYVLGGQGMEITYEEKELIKYLTAAFAKDKKNPVLIDCYLQGKEIEVDAICDGNTIVIPGIMEHLERAGIHSGDSISIYPPQNMAKQTKDEIVSITKTIAKALEVIGMINIQFVEQDGVLYIIEVNPRSSRTVPYISKVTNVPIIDIATQVMLGKTLEELGYTETLCPEPDMICVKIPTFSTEKLPRVEAALGPEMRSTGEVLGIGRTLEEALYKGFLAAHTKIPQRGGTILASIRQRDQAEWLPIANRFVALGYTLITVDESLNPLDMIKRGGVDLFIDIPEKMGERHDIGFKARRAATESSTTLMTSLDTVGALLDVMESNINIDCTDVLSLDEVTSNLRL